MNASGLIQNKHNVFLVKNMGNVSANNNTIPSDILNTMVNMRDELDSLIETIQIMNDKELMAGINSSKQDIIKENIHEISSADELALVWDE